MKRFFDPALLARTFRDPLAIANLGVDLLPLVAVFTLGWTATPLVALYWLENLIIGVFTVLRMAGSAFSKAVNFALCIFMIPFFITHYGMFCLGHGTFLQSFADPGAAQQANMLDGPGLVRWAINTGPHMLWFLAAIVAVGLAYFIRDFVLRGDFRRSDPSVEMFSPYGRIVTLHIAILLGAFLTLGLNQPMLGVLLLILIRVVFGVILSVRRRLKRDVAPIAAVAKS